MAGSAEVGALRITLGMDAADFESGVKRVTSSMDKLGVKFGVVAGIAQEFAGQFINRLGNAFEAVVTNIHSAIQEADKLGDLAQRIGVNVEVLSRLSEEEWERRFRHREFGVQGLRVLVRHIADHDIEHLRQIEAGA